MTNLIGITGLVINLSQEECAMGLFLAEFAPTSEVEALLSLIRSAISGAGGEFIEAQITAGAERVFVVVEHTDASKVDAALGAVLPGIEPVTAVRLVGDDLERVKAARGSAGYLVEWDLPAGLTMDAYLTRKKEKAPLYQEVPETQFLRTYVREDMVKCLCFYDAPDSEAVLKARAVVDAPVDRFHSLAPQK
jgi:hypothetical protein